MADFHPYEVKVHRKAGICRVAIRFTSVESKGFLLWLRQDDEYTVCVPFQLLTNLFRYFKGF